MWILEKEWDGFLYGFFLGKLLKRIANKSAVASVWWFFSAGSDTDGKLRDLESKWELPSKALAQFESDDQHAHCYQKALFANNLSRKKKKKNPFIHSFWNDYLCDLLYRALS